MKDNQELATFSQTGVPANPDDLLTGLQSVTSGITGGGGSMLLRLLKSGVYAYGQENIEPEPGSLWAINPYSIQHGFACWGDGELLGEVMVPFSQVPPAQSTLQDYGHPWNQQIALQLRCMTGDDKGTQLMYKGTSVGFRNAAKQIINDIIAQVSSDSEHVVPVVELEVDSYQHKKYGEVFIPVLEVKDWISMGDSPDVEEEKPKAQKVEVESAVEQSEIPEQEPKEQPTRRRRRRA